MLIMGEVVITLKGKWHLIMQKRERAHKFYVKNPVLNNDLEMKMNKHLVCAKFGKFNGKWIKGRSGEGGAKREKVTR